jgi:hypothetical protein
MKGFLLKNKIINILLKNLKLKHWIIIKIILNQYKINFYLKMQFNLHQSKLKSRNKIKIKH